MYKLLCYGINAEIEQLCPFTMKLLESDLGIDVKSYKVCILLYADD